MYFLQYVSVLLTCCYFLFLDVSFQTPKSQWRHCDHVVMWIYTINKIDFPLCICGALPTLLHCILHCPLMSHYNIKKSQYMIDYWTTSLLAGVPAWPSNSPAAYRGVCEMFRRQWIYIYQNSLFFGGNWVFHLFSAPIQTRALILYAM